jgi:K+-transporting ATPase ATPase A chain
MCSKARTASSYLATSGPALVMTAASLFIVFSAGALESAGPGLANLAYHGPHGLTEILYANVSAVATTGSAFPTLSLGPSRSPS